MKRLRLALLALFIVCISEFVQGASFTGADIRYRHIGGQAYEITLVRYRDCRSTPSSGLPIYVYNDSFQISINPTRVKIEEVRSAYCPQNCSPSNTTAGMGTEAHTYLDTVDFSSGVFTRFGTSAHPRVWFALSSCCRSGGLQGPTTAYHVEAMLDLQYARGNNAPLVFSDFANPVEPYLYAAQTFSYSFRLAAQGPSDSLDYRLVKMKDGPNSTIYGYDPYKAITYYCPNPNSQNCAANTTVNPVSGFSFNTANGNLMTTPRPFQNGTLVCQVNLYRPQGDSMVVAGYVKRDIQFVVLNNFNNTLPYILKNRDYNIKAREKFCVDIPVRDDSASAQSKADTVELELLKGPAYGSLKLLDSFSREKTMRYCWNPSDSDYLSGKQAEVFFRAREKSCMYQKTYAISNTITFRVVAPDSLASIRVKTFEDRNGNGKRDAGEPYIQTPFYTQQKGVYQLRSTDSSGTILYKPFYGQIRFGLPDKTTFYATGKDTLLQTAFDSSYTIELGFKFRSGISGTLFEDLNGNCVLDAGEKPLAGEKLLLKQAARAGFSDQNGKYILHAGAGTDTLILASGSAYFPNCQAWYAVNLSADSLQSGFHFPLRKRSSFKDLSVSMPPVQHLRNNQSVQTQIRVQNHGFKTEKSVQVKLLPARPLLNLSSSKTIFRQADTLIWVVDSIKSGGSVLIDFQHKLSSDSFKAGDQICYRLFLNNDSMPANNFFSACHMVLDSVPAFALKTALNPEPLTELDRLLTYTLSFRSPSEIIYRAIMRDTLDAAYFDLTSLIITDNPKQLRVQMLDNVLFAEHDGWLNPGEQLNLTYTIAPKSRFSKSGVLRNTVAWRKNADMDLDYGSVSNRISSAIQFGLLADSAYCPGETVLLPVQALYRPENGNRFKVYLSDAAGDFASATLLLDTQSKAPFNSLQMHLPRTLLPGNGYKLKVSGSLPFCNSFDEAFTQTITIHPLPVAILNSNLNKGRICTGDTLILQAGGGSQYRFYYGGYELGAFSSTGTYRFVPQSAHKVAAEVKDSNGCTDKTADLAYALSPLPLISAVAVPAEVCSGGRFVLRLNQQLKFDVYQNAQLWLQGADSGDVQSNALFSNALIRVFGTDSSGCRGSKDLSVSVNALPLKPVIYHNQKVLSSSYTSGNQWFADTVAIDSAKGRNFYPPLNGTYRVAHTDLKGCVAMSEPYQFRYYALNASRTVSPVSLFPNPAADHVYAVHALRGNVQMRIIGSDGRELGFYTLLPGKSSIDLRALPAGVFLVLMESEGLVYRSMLVKQ